MKNSSKTYKIILTFFVISFVIWFGGTIIRTSIAYDLFNPGIKMELNPELSNTERMNTIYLFSSTALLTGICYGIAAISSIILAFLSKRDFRKRGWLFMAFCLFMMTIPIQGRFIYMDYILANAVYYEKITDFFEPIIYETFIKRFTDVTYTSLHSITLLAALTCMLYSIWRPLEKKNITVYSEAIEKQINNTVKN
jgi:hypothetical protein